MLKMPVWVVRGGFCGWGGWSGLGLSGWSGPKRGQTQIFDTSLILILDAKMFWPAAAGKKTLLSLLLKQGLFVVGLEAQENCKIGHVFSNLLPSHLLKPIHRIRTWLSQWMYYEKAQGHIMAILTKSKFCDFGAFKAKSCALRISCLGLKIILYNALEIKGLFVVGLKGQESSRIKKFV